MSKVERLSSDWWDTVRAQAVPASEGWEWFCVGFREVTGRYPPSSFRRVFVREPVEVEPVKLLPAESLADAGAGGSFVEIEVTGEGWDDI